MNCLDILIGDLYGAEAYSLQELKRTDDFAAGLGLELVPCIQTLAHRWTALAGITATAHAGYAGYSDGGQRETEELLDAVLGHLSRTFRSRRIHVGMDEAAELGAGRYRQKYGYASHRELMKDIWRQYAVCVQNTVWSL